MATPNGKTIHLKAIQGQAHGDGKWDGKLRLPPIRLTFLKPQENFSEQIHCVYACSASPIIYRVYNPNALTLTVEDTHYLMVRYDRDILRLGYWARIVKGGVVWAEFNPKHIQDFIYSKTEGVGVEDYE